MSGYDSIRPIHAVVQPFPLEQWFLNLFSAIRNRHSEHLPCPQAVWNEP